MEKFSKWVEELEAQGVKDFKIEIVKIKDGEWSAEFFADEWGLQCFAAGTGTTPTEALKILNMACE